MIDNNLHKIKKRKKPTSYHSQRKRKENFGLLEQLDGSYHDWFEGRCTDKDLKKEQYLLLAVDDATNKITHCKFDKNKSIKNFISIFI